MTSMAHLDDVVVPYLRGDIDARERVRVDEHLAGCADCRDTVAAYQALLASLAAERPAAPAIDWRRWETDLEEKLDRRLGRRPARARVSAAWRSIPLALSGVLAAVLVYLAVHGGGEDRRTGGRDFAVLEEATLGQRLDLLRHYPVLEKLDLLEDLDVIGNLDRLAGMKQGRGPAVDAES